MFLARLVRDAFLSFPPTFMSNSIFKEILSGMFPPTSGEALDGNAKSVQEDCEHPLRIPLDRDFADAFAAYPPLRAFKHDRIRIVVMPDQVEECAFCNATLCRLKLELREGRRWCHALTFSGSELDAMLQVLDETASDFEQADSVDAESDSNK